MFRIQTLARHFSLWGNVPKAPPDAILGLTEAFNADTNPNKINLGVGAYRDDNNKPVVLKSVQEATRRIYEAKMDNEYLPISGLKSLISPTLKLVFGEDSELLKNDQVIGVQSLSGTGALRLATAFIARFWKASKPKVYIPNPTWPNHFNIVRDCGLEYGSYRYYDSNNKALDKAGMLEDIAKAPTNSVFILHVCAHNPTGCDPTPNDWKEISQAMKEHRHFALFDSAYQGFASGDTQKDIYPVRLFVEDGHVDMAVCTSFAKNFGLYGQRVGVLSMVCSNKQEKVNVESQLKALIRPMYSNPPSHGARIVSQILNDVDLKNQWEKDVKEMADRIANMRYTLRECLKNEGSTLDWSHITNQIGMFAYTGLNEAQVQTLIKDYHIYMTKDGRISVAGVNSKNVQQIAKAFHNVTKQA